MIKKDPIGNRVREIRLRLGIQQQQLAQEVGVSRQTIIAIEKGRLENPTIRVCLKIARILREPVDYVFYLDRHVFPDKSEMASPEKLAQKDAPAHHEHAISPDLSEGVCGPVISEERKEPDPNPDKAELSSRASLEQALPAFLRNLRTNFAESPVDSEAPSDVTYPSQASDREPGDLADGSM
jgi:putative transcriptional regulator